MVITLTYLNKLSSLICLPLLINGKDTKSDNNKVIIVALIKPTAMPRIRLKKPKNGIFETDLNKFLIRKPYIDKTKKIKTKKIIVLNNSFKLKIANIG